MSITSNNCASRSLDVHHHQQAECALCAWIHRTHVSQKLSSLAQYIYCLLATGVPEGYVHPIEWHRCHTIATEPFGRKYIPSQGSTSTRTIEGHHCGLPVSKMLQYLLLTLVVITICVLSQIVYRLCFHPLAAFPGPCIAAISGWPEFYHEVIRQGQFSKIINQYHDQYGRLTCQAGAGNRWPVSS